MAGAPVYLDLEDDVLESIKDLADPESASGADGLIQAVKATLDVKSGGSDMLLRHVSRVRTWESSDRSGPPPSLALLGLLSLAAEQMHKGEGISAQNFYGRLAIILNIPLDEQLAFTEDFGKAYRSKTRNTPVSELLWGSLGNWLEGLEGNRGLPTAYGLNHKHIGLPLSQALVRKTDREKLTDFFSLNDLAPRSSLPESEMKILLDEWLARPGCTATKNFIQLWRSGAGAQDRIVDIARLELSSWEGSGRSPSASANSSLDNLKVIGIKKGFASKSFQLSIAMPGTNDSGQETFELLDLKKQTIGELDFVLGAVGWMVLSNPGAIDSSSILVGETLLRSTSDGAEFRRRSRRIVPMRYDSMLQTFTEVTRVSLGDDHVLLVHPEIAAQVDQILDSAARPGFKKMIDTSGLPEGWIMYDNVQILSSVPEEELENRRVDLRVLQPLAREQVVLDGGLKLPGNILKWSSAQPPELRVTAEKASKLQATLKTVRKLAEPEIEERTTGSFQTVMIWPLDQEHLPDGDYEISVLADGKRFGNPITLRLRSADNPAVNNRRDQTPLTHDEKRPLTALSADRLVNEETFTISPPVSREDSHSIATDWGEEPMQSPEWRSARAEPRSNQKRVGLSVPVLPPDSCMVTGQHYIVVESTLPDAPKPKWLNGECKTCGLAKRYPSTGKRKRQATSFQTNTPPPVAVHRLEPVSDVARIGSAVVFDALCHIGQGSLSEFQRVTGQAEIGDTFDDELLRQLETVGHIEVERDPLTLAIKRWEMNDPALVELPNQGFVLTGFRSEQMIVALEDFCYENDITVTRNSDHVGPEVIQLDTCPEEALLELVSTLSTASNREVGVLRRASFALANTVPCFSDLTSQLPVISALSGRGFEQWNTSTARFERVADIGSAGAFRINQFRRLYVHRRREHIQESTAVLGDARLVKYMAALDTGTSLIGYDESQQLLFVPLGADLPGLYGRAAALAAGHPPVVNRSENVLEYRCVPPELAAMINLKMLT